MKTERLSPVQFDTLDDVPEPAENPRLVGHGETVQRILDAHAGGRLPHGIILSGLRGIGKATLAFHVARHLLTFPDGAQAPNSFAEPDQASSLFRQVASGAHPAVLHLTRPINEKTKAFKTVLSVDEIRRINRFLSHTSHDGGYRVVIVDSADDMNVQAANALLKNLEEPPARTVFMLIAHSRGSLLPTLRSRCQVYAMSPLAPDQLMEALPYILSDLPSSETERAALAERAGGSARQAILLLRHGGLEVAGSTDAVLRRERFDAVAAHRLADSVAGKGKELAFSLFREHLFDVVAIDATRTAQAGDLVRAEQLSSAWQTARESSEEALAFNLDRKQIVLDLLLLTHRALHN